MKNVYLIIGDGACGKSSLTRALTGLFVSGRTDVADISGNILPFKIWIRSAQEVEKSPQQVLREISNAEDDNVLITLRFDTYLGQPDAQHYFNLIGQHHIIKHVIFMSSGAVLSFSVPASVQRGFIDQSYSRPVNANAHIARQSLRWL